MNSNSPKMGVLFPLALCAALFGVVWRIQHCLYAHPASWVIASDMKTNADWTLQRCFNQPEGIAETAHPPGSAILFSLFRCGSENWRGVEFLLTFLSIAAIPLVWLLARRLGSREVASLSVIFTSFYPPFVFYGGFLLAEIPMLFVLLLGSNGLLTLSKLLEQKTRISFLPLVLSFGIGVIFGLGSTIKEQGLPILLLSMAYLLCTRFRTRSILPVLVAMALGAGLPLSYAAKRCTALSAGQFCLISNDAAQNLLFGVDPDLHIMEFESNGYHLSFGSPAAYSRGARGTAHFDFMPWEQEKLMPVIWQKVRERPLAVVQLMARHLYDLLGGSPLWPMIGEQPTWYSASGNIFFFWVVLLPFGVLILLEIVGIHLRFPEHSWVLFVPLFGSLALSLLASGEARYRIPCDAYFLIVAAHVWLGYYEKLRKRE